MPSEAFGGDEHVLLSVPVSGSCPLSFGFIPFVTYANGIHTYTCNYKQNTSLFIGSKAPTHMHTHSTDISYKWLLENYLSAYTPLN